MCALLLSSVAMPIITMAGIYSRAPTFEANVATTSNIESEPGRSNATESDINIKDGFYKTTTDKWRFRRNGSDVKASWITTSNGKYYMDSDGNMISNRFQDIYDRLYYFDADGCCHEGWLLYGTHWYYFTNTGAAVGYTDIGKEEEKETFYFNDDGTLFTNGTTPDGRTADEDGYLFDESDIEGFVWTGDRNAAPGELSGLVIAGQPVEFYMLSIAGETSGGEIIMGDRGRAYGLCQFDYRYDLTDFIRWAYTRHPELWAEFADFVGYQNGNVDLVGNRMLQNAFAVAMSRSYEGAVTDQLEYMRSRYFDSFASAMNAAGYRLNERHIAVSAALFSVNVNCGAQANIFISNLSPDMTDSEMICKIYEIRNTILAEQLVCGSKKGTTARYRKCEPLMALDLLHGYTTVDSHKSYGGGVSWHGNIFSNAVSTVAIDGSSTEWTETPETNEAVTEETTEESTEAATDASTSEEYGPGMEIAAKAAETNASSEAVLETSLDSSDDIADRQPTESLPQGNAQETFE